MSEPANIIIHIHWSGPHSLDHVASLNGPTDFGIYQIYGGHHVYGSDVLLYIGKAQDRTFATRLPEHKWCSITPDPKQISDYVGRLFGDNTPDNATWSSQIDLAERLLIYAHSPASNTQKELGGSEKNLWHVHVVNWGSYRNLLPEVTGARWTERFDDLPCNKHYSNEHFKKEL